MELTQYPDTPWGHLQRLKAKQQGREKQVDMREEPEPVPTTETVTKKKRKKRAKKKT